MQPLIDPKLRALKPIGKDTSANRHRKVPGHVKRLRHSNIWNRVIELGSMSDAVVVHNAKVKSEIVSEVKSLRELVEHEQKFTGSLGRLKRSFDWSMKIPAK